MSTPANTPAVAPVEKTKGKQLATTVPQAFYEAIDAIHWEKRVKVSDIVREALEDYVLKNGVDVSGNSAK